MTIIKNPNGKTWYAKFYYKDHEGITRQKSISTGVSIYGSKKAAKEIGKRLQDEFIKKIEQTNIGLLKSTRETKSNMTISEYAGYWLEQIKGSVKENSRISYRDIVNAHIIPLLGNIKLSDLG